MPPRRCARCRASSAAPRTARKLQLHSHAQHAGTRIPNASPHRASDYFPLCPRSLRRYRFSQHSCCRYAALCSLTAEHAAARSLSAPERHLTRATHMHQLLLCPGRTARTPLRIAARAMLALRSVGHMLPPPLMHRCHSTVQPSLVPVRHRKNKLLIYCCVFVLLVFSAAHAAHLHLLQLHGHLRVAI